MTVHVHALGIFSMLTAVGKIPALKFKALKFKSLEFKALKFKATALPHGF